MEMLSKKLNYKNMKIIAKIHSKIYHANTITIVESTIEGLSNFIF